MTNPERLGAEAYASFTMPQALLRQMLEGVTPAALTRAADIHARPSLGCVRVEAEAGALTLAATDTYRLAFARAEVAAPDLAEIIRADALRPMLTKLSKRAGRMVDVELGDGSALFHAPGWSHRAYLGFGDYPRWQRIIPKEKPSGVWEFNRAALLDALAQAKTATRGMSAPAGNRITLRADRGLAFFRTEGGEVEAEVGAYTGHEGFAQAFDRNYLQDLIRGSVSDTPRLQHFGGDSPWAHVSPTLASEARDGYTWNHMLMPMQLPG